MLQFPSYAVCDRVEAHVEGRDDITIEPGYDSTGLVRTYSIDLPILFDKVSPADKIKIHLTLVESGAATHRRLGDASLYLYEFGISPFPRDKFVYSIRLPIYPNSVASTLGRLLAKREGAYIIHDFGEQRPNVDNKNNIVQYTFASGPHRLGVIYSPSLIIHWKEIAITFVVGVVSGFVVTYFIGPLIAWLFGGSSGQ